MSKPKRYVPPPGKSGFSESLDHEIEQLLGMLAKDDEVLRKGRAGDVQATDSFGDTLLQLMKQRLVDSSGGT